jgi:riboflavin synthase
LFTGIIEELGTVTQIQKGARSSVLTIHAKKVLQGTQIGDSIATNGVCLTVTAMAGSSFMADVMAETLRCSSLGRLKTGDPVHLERALTLSSRLGGHLVSGHIDGTGTIENIRAEDNAIWLSIAPPLSLLRYIVKKGSVAIDGVSLTVASVTEGDFSVSIIPHTGAETILLQKKIGDIVNVECDMIAKYTEKLLRPPSKPSSQSQIDEDFLKRYGFFAP